MNLQRSKHENLIQEALQFFGKFSPKNVFFSQVLSNKPLPVLQELGE